MDRTPGITPDDPPATGVPRATKRSNFAIEVNNLKLNALFATIATLGILTGGLMPALMSTALADDLPKGQTSGLPLPRFVSIKSNPVNVRRGPSADYDVAWKFLKAGIPVEVTQEFDIWFRIRDSEGQEGWIQKTLLSGRRTALVSPWDKGAPIPLKDKNAGTVIVANLEHNVMVDVTACDGTWCRVLVEGTKGWIEQQRLWGVYPGEKIE